MYKRQPIYGKLDAELASAMMSINAIKGVEIGLGNEEVEISGDENSDEIRVKNKKFLENYKLKLSEKIFSTFKKIHLKNKKTYLLIEFLLDLKV